MQIGAADPPAVAVARHFPLAGRLVRSVEQHLHAVLVDENAAHVRRIRAGPGQVVGQRVGSPVNGLDQLLSAGDPKGQLRFRQGVVGQADPLSRSGHSRLAFTEPSNGEQGGAGDEAGGQDRSG